MNLKFIRDYQSIKKFSNISIEDFCVITGLNGSGKTHLLNAINNGSVVIENIDNSEVILYNYNDFNVHNVDLNNKNTNNQFLLLKYNSFKSKSQGFADKLNGEKNNALSSFKIMFYGQDITNNNINSIHNSLINISEQEKYQFKELQKQFEKDSKFDAFHRACPRIISQMLVNLKVDVLKADIEQVIIDAEIWRDKVYAFMILQYNNFEISGLNIDQSELEFYWESLKDYNKFPSPSLNLNTYVSSNVINFCNKISSLGFNGSIKILKQICSWIPLIHTELKDYINNEDNYELYKQLESINGIEDIFKPITVADGFLNLKEIELEEKNYQLEKLNNEFNEFQNSKDGKTPFYSTEKFEEIFGDSPVNLMNKVLNEYDCNGYILKQSELKYAFDVDMSKQNVAVHLYNKNEDYITNIDSLSSGEKTLLALVFSIYKLKQKKALAKILLLDEVDSALHPSMSKRLINVLYNFFYCQLGIKIIISTHSPSTVAFAPENSLYVMRRNEEPRLIKVSKDSALKELTLGVPSLSINYENRRQVFVESKYDVEYYEVLYRIYANRLNSEISLNFIASGDAKKDRNGVGISSCSVVKDVVSKIRNAGSDTVWGIIDWDNEKTTPNASAIKVLGFDRRYSIENFILDPLLMGILMLREKKLSNEDIGLPKSFQLYELVNPAQATCQIIIDFVTRKLSESLKQPSSNPISYSTIDGLTLFIPEFIKTTQGHKLEELYLTTFKFLGEISHGKKDNELKNTVIKKVIDDYPNLAPIELLEILNAVQEI